MVQGKIIAHGPHVETQEAEAREYRAVAAALEGEVGGVMVLSALPIPADRGESRALQSPLRVRVEYADAEYVVSDDTLLMYGHGLSLAAALTDFGATLLEYHDLLIEREEAGTLGRNEEAHLDLLDNLFGVLEEVHPEGGSHAG